MSEAKRPDPEGNIIIYRDDAEAHMDAQDAEIARLTEEPREAFVRGAKFWEQHTTGGFTMWTSDRKVVECEADRRYPHPTRTPPEEAPCKTK
jgi:hypothetical protein